MIPRAWHVEVQGHEAPAALRVAAEQGLRTCQPEMGLRWYKRATPAEVRRRHRGLVWVPDASRGFVFFLDRHTVWLSVDQTPDDLTKSIRHEIQSLRDLAGQAPPRNLDAWLDLESRARNAEGIDRKSTRLNSSHRL